MTVTLRTAEPTRDERSRRTERLLAAAHGCPDPARRTALLDEVVVLNCRVADAVAWRYRDRGVPVEDLRQAAYEGLVKAVRRFDPAHAEDLLTFAVPTIRGEVQRYFRDRSWMVRPPRRVQELQARVNDAAATLAGTLGREPSVAEVCDLVGIGRAEHAEAEAAYGCFQPTSLDRPAGARSGADGDGGATIGDLVADEREAHGDVEVRHVVGHAVRSLTDRDRRLLWLRFYEERSQREIGDELGLTQTQVSRWLDRVLRTMRATVGVESAA